MRQGIHFDSRHPHEAVHLAPLQRRLVDLRAGHGKAARVVVSADPRPPVRGAWDVQVFHGLGDLEHTLNPIFLQKGRFPRLRMGLNRMLSALRLPAPLLQPPPPGCRAGRFSQVNAYGPRYRDRLEDMLQHTVVSAFGHVALNEAPPVRIDPEGPVLWLPTWDKRALYGGRAESSLAAFAHEVAITSQHVPFRVKLHPVTLATDQDRQPRRELEAAEGARMVPPGADPYTLFDGIRGLVTDTSAIGFEAFALGVPVALARPAGYRYRGLQAELAARVPVLSSGKPDLLQWAERPEPIGDRAWVEDLLFKPDPARNDDFAADLRERARPKR